MELTVIGVLPAGDKAPNVEVQNHNSQPTTGQMVEPNEPKQKPPQTYTDKKLCQQSLEQNYSIYQRTEETVDPNIFEQTATNTTPTSFGITPKTTNRPSTYTSEDNKSNSLFHAGPLLEDLNYSLRNFAAANPADDPNALFARIAVREGRSTQPGYIPSLPEPRRFSEGKEAKVHPERKKYGCQ